MTTINCRFGFDLDNTLIDYSDAIKKYCVQNRIEPQESLSSLRKVLKNFDTSDKGRQISDIISFSNAYASELSVPNVYRF